MSASEPPKMDVLLPAFNALEAACRDARRMLLYARDLLAAAGDHAVAMTFEREAAVLELACVAAGMELGAGVVAE